MGITTKDGPFAVVAKKDALFSEMGLLNENIEIIYEANGNYKSYKPGRDLNAITGITRGVGYIVQLKNDYDLSLYFINYNNFSFELIPIGQGNITIK